VESEALIEEEEEDLQLEADVTSRITDPVKMYLRRWVRFRC